jgi:diacylglycerol kinase (ATP)
VRRAVTLLQSALDADLHVTETRNAPALAEWLEQRAIGYRTVVVVGGDGSLGIAYNVLAGRDVVLGHVPAGFGNATAHLLRLPREPERVAEIVSRGSGRALDLVRVEGDGVSRLALFAGIGWDALVAGRYADAGARGLAGWAWAVASSLPDLRVRPPVEVRIDGRHVYKGPIEMMVAGTTPYFGRGLLANPGARPDRGALTVRVYRGPPTSFAVELLRWIAKRTARTAPWQASTVEILRTDGGRLLLQADGDVLGERERWQFGIAPAATRLIGNW